MHGEGAGRERRRLRVLGRVTGLASLGVAVLPLAAHASERDDTRARPFTVVLERVLHGDLVMAANSNLLSAGGWDMAASSVADVDGDRSVLCVRRRSFDAACADNSSSAALDIPSGARVVHARLYVETSLSTSAGPLRVRLAGPGAAFDYTVLGAATRGVPKLYESTAAISSRAVLRQAVWDVTRFVNRRGSGRYTVADIVSERATAYLPYASWAVVAAYELDPAAKIRELAPEQRPRFARRAVSWHDGFMLSSVHVGSVAAAESSVVPGDAVYAKSLHLVANARQGEPDNLLFNGRPLGNNLTPGDRAPPPGVTVAGDRSCNSTTDVFNDTICVLGAPVATKRPGSARYLASGDGTTRSSGSAVDIDVIRIPDRYLVAGSVNSVLSVRTVSDDPMAVGVLAISADLGH